MVATGGERQSLLFLLDLVISRGSDEKDFWTTLFHARVMTNDVSMFFMSLSITQDRGSLHQLRLPHARLCQEAAVLAGCRC
jgi:hypothetical protein